MPNGLEKHRFWTPGNNPREAEIDKRMCELWKDKYK
jgi:hypothetical protein